jgi:CheY-like chemotaxis protein
MGAGSSPGAHPPFRNKGFTVDLPHQPVDASKVQVLFVDDDSDAREIALIQLDAAGFKVTTAANGLTALALFDALHFDVVVTDIFMPEEDGLELIQNLRGRRPALPIVAVTGGGRRRDTSVLDAALAFGAGAVIEKPISGDALVAAILRVLEATTGSPE